MNRLISSIILSMVAISALSQGKEDKPTLVVGIMIDQLRSDYLELLQSHFGANGFNRLMKQGVYFDNVDFNVPCLDAVSGTAIIYSGAYPLVNGIPSEKIYDLNTRTPRPILNDVSKIGNFTEETLSPVALHVSTIADELRVNSYGLGYVYSISPNAQQAIIAAGHAGNSACWINDLNGKWATTTFYTDMPQLMSQRNYAKPLAARMDTMVWNPLLTIDKYPNIPDYRKYYPFKYFYSESNKDRYRAYKQSALVNEEITSVAIDYIKTLSLGKRGQLDMLNIAYTVAPYEYTKESDIRIELQDTYIRLDRQLEYLFNEIDKTVGLNKTVIFVASTGYYNDNSKADTTFKIPTGQFMPKRAVSLLNMYLMAIYGNGEWVTGYNNQQFFLNRKLIKEKNVDLVAIRNKSSELLRQMSGITRAYTLEEILNNPNLEETKRLQHATVPSYSGDIRVEVSPGWEIVEDETQPQKSKQVRTNAISTPILILAPRVEAQKVTTPVDATILAPTVSRILRIRSPNAARTQPLSL